MLHIQLQLVHLVEAEGVSQFLQVLHGLDPAPGGIVVKSSVFDVGLILNGDPGQKPRLLTHDLAQGLNRIPQSVQTAAGEERAFSVNLQTVVILIQGLIHLQQNIPLAENSPADVQLQAGPGGNLLLQLPCIDAGPLRA